MKYEFVWIIDPNYSMDDIKNILNEIKTKLENVIDEDDIGFLDLVYEIKWNRRWYFISYLVEIDPLKVEEKIKDISLIKWVMRCFMYKMRPFEKYLKFHEINKRFELTEEEKKQEANKNAFEDAANIQRMK